MKRGAAAGGSALFFALAPGTVAGLLPWALTGWHTGAELPWAVRGFGALLIFAGLLVLVPAFVRFVVEGAGTPAPVAQTDRLVVGGAYRFVRNPMYVAVLLVVVGQAMVLGRAGLVLYALVAAAAMVGFVKGYEEPHLARTYGAEYEAYRRAVPGWWPRCRRSGCLPSRDGEGG
ncbi:isoprenylcysteine carboxylmethyltransferase family protein [Actinoplanes sp. NPDC049118]|uniref:methyltransferase family protein n=1 Tax=Actinoplanes sp. NPDC049118 TaxID=3155769 RepID=UPI0034064448